MTMPISARARTGKCAFLMDLCGLRPYFGFAMIRHVLTFLALITGLAATAAPSEARVCAPQGAEIHVELQAAQVAVAWHAVCTFAADARPATTAIAEPTPPAIAAADVGPHAPTALVGIDRARE
ncbi:MAG: hypothetical protein R3E21_08235 [Caenibius sp.]